MAKRSFSIRRMEFPFCPGCGDGNEGKETMVTGVLQCTGCNALVGRCYRGEALALVRLDLPAKHSSNPYNRRYYDFTWIDTQERVTGYFDRVDQCRITMEEG